MMAACLLPSATSSYPGDQACEPVRIAQIGYVRDEQGRHAAVPDTNLTRYEVVMTRCRKGRLAWKARRYYGAADSINLNHHRVLVRQLH